MKELFKNRSFVLIWLGQAASGLGNTFATFIMAWLVYKITGSYVAMGGIWIFYMIPTLLTQIWSGPFLDRWDRKLVMISSEWIRGMAFLFPAIMLTMGSLQLWHLYLTVFIVGLSEPLFRPSSMAYVAGAVPQERLMKANSLLEGTMQLMLLIGPPLGGLMVQWVGAQLVLFSLVGAMVISGALLLFISSDRPKNAGDRDGWFKEFKAGLQFYRMTPVLLWIGMLIMVANFCFGAITPLFLPYITEILGGTSFHFGLFTSSLSLGMIIASIWIGSRKEEPKNRRNAMLGALLATGVMMALLGSVTILQVAFLFIAINGFCMIVFNVNNVTIFQKLVPAELRGRVFAVRTFFINAGVPLGALLGGIFAESWGISALLVLVGGVVVVVTGVAFLSPVFRTLNTATASQEGEEVTS